MPDIIKVAKPVSFIILKKYYTTYVAYSITTWTTIINKNNKTTQLKHAYIYIYTNLTK